MYAKVIERCIRERIKFRDDQLSLRPGRGTTDAVLTLRQVRENVLEGNNKRYWSF